MYAINQQIEAFADQVRFVIPDRSGYGRSARLPRQLPTDFHQRAAGDALGIDRAIFWGHSDGAVIAARIGLLAPQRCLWLILEAFHFYRSTPNSRGFFKRFATHPDDVPEKTRSLLLLDHGDEQWRKLVQRNCRAWLKIATRSKRSVDDLYDGRLSELKVPVTLMYGRGDPRTEPGEMERASEALMRADMRLIEVGRHSPHSERESWRECNRILSESLVRK